MLATATHDTKRGEDARTRIDVLSDMPEEWARALRLFRDLHAAKKVAVDGRPAPSPNEEYLLYQTLLGAWPIEPASDRKEFRERIKAYFLKAIREAKVNTDWLEPNVKYEEAAAGFVDGVLPIERPNAFLEAFRPFQKRVAFFGALNSLAQTVLKMTCPGVPDFYQGSELWDFNLVDPDNRRPVDYEVRKRMLRAIRESAGKSGYVDRLVNEINV